MATRRYRYSWDSIAALDCDHMASWGAFDADRSETVDFDDDTLPSLAFKTASDGKSFSVAYQWAAGERRQPGEFTQSQAALARRPCRFGGTRAYFICPSCGRTTLRLAVLPEGLRCGPCGRVTWDSRRLRPLQRLMRRADKIAVRLGCDSWREVPVKKPPNMRAVTFEQLRCKLGQLEAEINRELGVRLARSRGGLIGRMAKLVRLGA